ncbi:MULTISPECIES: GDSL-type esterase/lipase family protein [Enterococcaceae]|uniref:SGNH/GDSL hydrolase family protein n=1 Tax=Enterococcaceae TaxID=81852 RepID=UPI000E4C770E|nr:MULTISPECIES: GDSL-type esterase/lipase family protein [Enterococcaceae]RGI30283.1 lipase [Melissococcus sp. OM08-11BH]UNM89281.1 GDSL-type esterase/lipase family protein [Vagococcus sp. CY52-2]
MKKIILFGDSITAGYRNGEIDIVLNTKIKRLLNTKIEIINAGIPGDTTKGALSRFKEHVIFYEPDIVTIFFGANDAEKRSGISLLQYEENLTYLVEQIGAKKVVLIGPPYAHQMMYRDERPLVELMQYNNAAQRVAKTFNIRYIDILKEMIVSEAPTRFLEPDGLHFSDEGYDLLAKLIVETIKERV